ncbi:radical SAM protein, partial [Candidatus Micrarchaeota archaeon]|nr:radical SAM protein [Candidatus Micrarchaeota archaeon]
TLRIMKKSGGRLLCVGIESGVQEILNNISKGTQIEKIRQFFKDTKRAGILVHGCFMLGNQGETKETIAQTIRFAKELNPDTAQFFPLMVYPGTETYDWARENKFLKSNDFRDWLNAEGGHNCMVSRPGLSSEELVSECNRARKEFYLRPNYVASKAVQLVMHPREAKRIFKASRTFFRHLRERGKE